MKKEKELKPNVDKTTNKENKMKVSEALETLKKYNKWRRGKGKKYAQPGFPADLTPELIGQAIDRAILTMKHRISYEDFLVLNTLVAECIKSRKAAKGKLTDAENAAIRKMAKVVRYITINPAD